ncbi:MAG: biotin-dependent carboxyltransferase family protein [Saprospiraceae bacterium]
MSIGIIRAGILDTIQDTGRFGWRQLGINPGGAMDLISAQLANILAGNDKNDAVIEIHFPGSVYQFEQPAIIVITGADFYPTVNEKAIALNQPVVVSEFSILRFTHPGSRARCYLAIAGGFDIPKWLGSYGTHLKAQAGGFNGRRLLKNDQIPFRRKKHSSKLSHERKTINGINIPGIEDQLGDEIQFIPGPEWEMLSDESRSLLIKEEFNIQLSSDRMGYRLSGPALMRSRQDEMVSSPVALGTIQLLPDGQLIVLMADHQTTGGYPRIGCIITAHLPLLAQKNPGDHIRLKECNVRDAEFLIIGQQEYLSTLEKQIQNRDQ